MSGNGKGWWRDEAALSRFIADLVQAELSRLRPGGSIARPLPWQPEMDLGSGGLGMDSLEFLSVATALTETLHLHRSGIEDYLLARRTPGDWVRIAAQALSVFDAEITFRTSGSTGTPKPCRHALSALEREAAALARMFGPKQRVTGMVPAHHIYGFLFTILLPRLLGAEHSDAQGRLPGRVVAGLTAGDLLVAVPEHWAALARSAPADLSGIAGVCSTGPLDPAVFRTLIDSGLDLVEIYGASETGGIGWRRSPDAPFRLLEGLVLSADGAEILHGWDGASRTLPDRLVMMEEGVFRLDGRRDGAVQIGGINVFPDRVAEALRRHPKVAAAAVRPLPVPGGIRLKAFIVPVSPQDEHMLADEFNRWAETSLPPQERPRHWTFGDKLPVSALGKLRDW